MSGSRPTASPAAFGALLAILLALPRGALAQAVPEPPAPRPQQAPTSTPPLPLVPPKILGEVPQAEYPPPEISRGQSARVVIELVVTEEGTAKDAKVVTPPQEGFDERALAVVPRLRFSPATQGDKPVPVRIQFAVNFAAPARADQPSAAPVDATSLPVNLAGQLRERGTRRKLSGIEVAVPAAGLTALTDPQGRFELRGVPEGKQEVVVAAPGYDRFSVQELIEPGKKLEVLYLLNAIYSSPYEAVVTGQAERREISKTSISIAEVNRVAGTQGDALKVIEDLPGAARTSPIGGGQLVIRGSNPGDSLVFLDGLNLPLLYHFGALSSTVNPDLLEAIDYVPGNFSATYGDMIGGLVSVRSRPLREELHGYANVNLIESSALVEGQLPGDSGIRASISGRRSTVGEVLKAAIPAGSVGLVAAPVYWDAQLRLDWKPRDSGHQLQLIALGSDDRLEVLFQRPLDTDPNVSGSLDIETGYDQIRLKDQWRSGPWSVDTVGMYEHLILRFGFGSDTFSLIGNSYYLRSVGSYDFDGDLAGKLSLSAGFESINRHVNVSSHVRASGIQREGDPNQNAGPRADDQAITTTALPFNRYSPALFLEARWRPLPGLLLTPGLRTESYLYTGQPSVTRALLPRLTARYDLGEELAVKAGAGLYAQGARNGDASAQFGNPAILPQRAVQLTAGAEWRPAPGLFASVEGFYKRETDLIVTAGQQAGAVSLDNAGIARIVGLEVLLRKELTDRLFGWVAYTLSSSERLDRPGQQWRKFDYDQTHNLTVVASYQLPRGWQVGGRFRLISGNPSTPVLGATYLAATDTYLPIFGPTNSDRLPLFHQLDVRIDKVWTFDAWTLDLFLDVLNVYNQKSIEGIRYAYDFSASATVGGLPVLPSLGLKGAF